MAVVDPDELAVLVPTSTTGPSGILPPFPGQAQAAVVWQAVPGEYRFGRDGTPTVRWPPLLVAVTLKPSELGRAWIGAARALLYDAGRGFNSAATTSCQFVSPAIGKTSTTMATACECSVCSATGQRAGQICAVSVRQATATARSERWIKPPKMRCSQAGARTAEAVAPLRRPGICLQVLEYDETRAAAERLQSITPVKRAPYQGRWVCLEAPAKMGTDGVILSRSGSLDASERMEQISEITLKAITVLDVDRVTRKIRLVVGQTATLNAAATPGRPPAEQSVRRVFSKEVDMHVNIDFGGEQATPTGMCSIM